MRNYPPRACLACLGVAKRARAAVAVAAGGRRWPPVGGQPKLIEGIAYSLRTNNEKNTLGSCGFFFSKPATARPSEAARTRRNRAPCVVRSVWWPCRERPPPQFIEGVQYELTYELRNFISGPCNSNFAKPTTGLPSEDTRIRKSRFGVDSRLQSWDETVDWAYCRKA